LEKRFNLKKNNNKNNNSGKQIRLFPLPKNRFPRGKLPVPKKQKTKNRILK